MEVDTHHAAISAAVTDPSDMRTVPSQTSSGARASDRGLKRRYGMALVTDVAERSATRALEEENLHQWYVCPFDNVTSY